MRLRRALIWALVFPAIAVVAGGSCALGEEEPPGCRDDSECEDDFVCRGGACFRITTPLSPPHDPGAPDDAGLSGDADDAGETGDSGDAGAP